MTTSPTPEELLQAEAFAARLRTWFGGEMPEGANVNWDYAGRAVMVLPLVEAEIILSAAEVFHALPKTMVMDAIYEMPTPERSRLMRMLRKRAGS